MLPLLPRKMFEMRQAAKRGERAAARHWGDGDGTIRTDAAPIAIRRATGADCARLFELAQLDEVEFHDGPFLVAEESGEIEAVLPLSAGPAFSDPFRPTRELFEMLELRARQLGFAGARRSL
jgi:hypothetical protein